MQQHSDIAVRELKLRQGVQLGKSCNNQCERKQKLIESLRPYLVRLPVIVMIYLVILFSLTVASGQCRPISTCNLDN